MKPHLYIPPTSNLASHGPSTSTNNGSTTTTNTTTTIYEPSEDSFLLVDAVSSSAERRFLHNRFSSVKQGRATQASPTPFVFEVGVGSGVVLGYVSAYAEWVLGRRDVLCAGGDVNRGAVRVGGWNVEVAGRERGWKGKMMGDSEGEKLEVSGGVTGNGTGTGTTATGLGNSEEREADSAADKTTTSTSTACGPVKNNTQIPANGQALFLDIIHSSLLTALAPKNVDILLFNPPYVPTETLPAPTNERNAGQSTFETESHLYALAYAGGHDGMEVTNKLLAQLDECLSDRGVAYILFCARNRPEEVRVRLEGKGWGVVVAGESGGKGGWERLCVLRVYRKVEGEG